MNASAAIADSMLRQGFGAQAMVIPPRATLIPENRRDQWHIVHTHFQRQHQTRQNTRLYTPPLIPLNGATPCHDPS
jgi:hypothetical protein